MARLDEDIHDRMALDEMALYSEALSAAAATDRPLTSEELDRALGVRREGDHPAYCES